MDVLLATLAGLVLGSFANVVIYRVPRKESIAFPGSHCPSCGHAIGVADNIPVLSWLILRGRCRWCRAPIGWRYPAVELLTGALFGLAAGLLPRPTDLIAFLPLLWALVVLAFIDIQHKLLPNVIVLPLIALEAGLFAISAALGPGLRVWVQALETGAVGFGFFFLLVLIAPAGMGMGDVKLSAVLGMALGYFGHPWHRLFVGFFLAFLIGALAGIGLMAARRGGMKTQIPFGPYLALGTTITIFWGGHLVRLWLRG